MTGCQSNQNDQTSSKASTQATSEVAKSSASIKLTDSNKEITSKKVTYQSGDSLLEILKANFEVKEKMVLLLQLTVMLRMRPKKNIGHSRSMEKWVKKAQMK